MNKKTLLITGTSGFIGYNFLKYILLKNYLVIDILRIKNKKNVKLKNLKKKYPRTYKNIFFSEYSDLNKKIKKLKVNYFINFATLYKNNHEYDDIFNFIKSNILFPSLLYELVCKKVSKVINFGSMMQHQSDEKFTAKNFYAATKNAFEMINNFYNYSYNKTKFYNLKLYESFGENDHRNKLIPTIIKNYKKNKITNIVSKKLELNIVHVNDINNAIMILLNSNIKSGTYCLKSKKNIRIIDLVKDLNKKLKKKIKVRFLKKTVTKITNTKIKKLPKWKEDINLMKKISSNFNNEKN